MCFFHMTRLIKAEAAAAPDFGDGRGAEPVAAGKSRAVDFMNAQRNWPFSSLDLLDLSCALHQPCS